MEILSASPTLPTTSITLSDMTDVVTSLPLDKIGSALDNVTPDLEDVADLAAAVAKSGSRLGVRTVRTSVRVARRNPRLVGGTLAGLIIVVALAIFLKKRNETPEAVSAH